MLPLAALALPLAVLAPVDTLVFGTPAAEAAHALSADHSDVVQGGLGTSARRLLPLETPDWQGGTLRFKLAVDPAAPNYVTIRLWGDDVTDNRLYLYVEGKQLGYRHLGDIDQLDYGTEDKAYNGRFYYNTSPLPLELTRGKTALACEIRSTGRIWAYGDTFARYQYAMTVPTRGIYAFYTHTDPYFVPPPTEVQGVAPANPPVRPTPGPELLDAIKQRIQREIVLELKQAPPLNQMQMQFLAHAWHVPWCAAYRNEAVVAKVLAGLDHQFVAYRAKPELAQAEPSTWNPDWFGLGPCGDVLRLLAEPLTPSLDQTIDDGAGARPTRRAAFTEMLLASRDWHRRHRRQYTNQSMINDLYVYLANRGIRVLDPARALPEPEALRYLYESVGLQPWLGSDTDAGPAKPLGDDYWQLTDQGLTKELGYVGTYGEVLDWMAQLYEATGMPGQPGDPKLRAQMVKAAKARAAFRYPAVDADGYRAMRLECVVGWRDLHLPGDVTYAQRASWDGTPLQLLAAALDPTLTGYAQQMLADNQYFAVLAEHIKNTGFRVTAGLLAIPEQYQTILAQPSSTERLPMAPGSPDYLFSDEDDGVLALKHGDEVLYVSLYWRARYAVNFLARVHLLSPTLSRIAVVREETQFEPSGLTYTRPDWTDFGFGNGGHRYPGEWHSAHAGEHLPIAKIPPGVPFKPGDENVYAGRGQFYALRYGPYLIGMNTTREQTFELAVPAGANAIRLPNGVPVAAGGKLAVAPRSTVVLSLAGP